MKKVLGKGNREMNTNFNNVLYWTLDLNAKMLFKCLLRTFSILFPSTCLICSQQVEHRPIHYIDKGVGVSSNPSPTDHIGTGYFGEKLFETFGWRAKDDGLTLESLWILDGNQLLSGGKPSQDKGSVNNLVQFELLFNPDKVSNWKGALFAIELLQLNGSQTNANAGLVQGFEGLIQASPLNRTSLYEWWYRQELLDGNLITRIGKSTPNSDFNCVNRLFPMNDKRVSPVASGIIAGTIFTQGSLSSFLPSYYNSAFGASVFYFPIKDFYLSVGGYDGNKAHGEQTDLKAPQFNGYYLLISESGYSWSDAELPGRVAVGVWRQTGKLTLDTKVKSITQQGAYGSYFYGSQRLWWKDKMHANSGIVTYLQLGINNTKTLPINKFLGWGLSAYGLVPGRLKDSFGLGLSLAGLNKNSEPYSSEWMFQTYYQCCVYGSFYLEPVISYIPRPGAAENLPQTWAATLRVLALF
ncbi:MAG: carbohydrate porin [Chlamydiales bacterium]|nr:carbohydrate porin [Chlamydiales bacterium]